MYEFGAREIKAFEQVVESGQHFRYRGGEGGECDKFEAELCRKLNCKHSILLSGGTAALMCGLVGLDVGPGDEVIVPGYTFMASPLAVLGVGAIPVIAEVDESLTLDPADVDRKVTPQTKAIMPVHMVGLPSDMNALKRIARKHSLRIIEDACQAVGGSYRGKRLTTIGDVGAFSFNFFKIIGFGEGGAVVTSDPLVYQKALIHHDGGAAFRGHELLVAPFCGMSFRVSEFHGAVMRVQLKRLDRILKRLRARKRALAAALAGSSAFVLNPVNCEQGDCGVVTAIRFGSEPEMRAAAAALSAEGIGAWSPFDTGIHVYSRWEPILAQRGASDPRRNPYNLTKKKYRYSQDMCPQTLEVLGSTLFISTDYSRTPAQHRALGRKARSILEKL